MPLMQGGPITNQFRMRLIDGVDVQSETRPDSMHTSSESISNDVLQHNKRSEHGSSQ
jgi:hypothetical protein